LSRAEGTKVAIVGAGGMGREALAWLRDARPDVAPVAFFTADGTEKPHGADVDLPVFDVLTELLAQGVDTFLLAIGNNTRRSEVDDLVSDEGSSIISVIHPSSFVGPGVAYGEGIIIAPGCVLTRDISLGRGCIVNYGARVGHGCSLGDFSFIGPGAVLTGEIRVGERSMVGAGAVITPGVVIGQDVQVGAGAVVISDVPDGVVMVGNPASTIGRSSSRG